MIERFKRDLCRPRFWCCTHAFGFGQHSRWLFLFTQIAWETDCSVQKNVSAILKSCFLVSSRSFGIGSEWRRRSSVRGTCSPKTAGKRPG